MNQKYQRREALRSFVEAMDLCGDYPDTSTDRERLDEAKRQAEQALAAEPTPLVRITPEKIREIYASGPMTYIEFANAIMDAMERVNK